MKKLSITTLFLAALAAGFSVQPARAQVQVNISIGGFYDELEPYGRWVDCSYGDCWVPERVSRGWQPYSNGEWVYTEYGWTWVSSDPWGDSPYHYGTWVYNSRYGWEWVPGTVWAPAWVTWSYSNNYVGWAPLPPSIAFGSSGYSGRAIRMRPTQYVFVPTNRFIGSNVASVRISSQRSASIFSQTTPVTRFGVSGGIVRNNTAIPFATIQRATSTPIQTRSIRDARTAPRPVTEWMRGDRQQMSIVAPARDVRAAIASRPQGGSRTGGSPGSTGGNQRIIRNPETQQQPAAPRGDVSRKRPQPIGRAYQPPAAAPTAVPAQVESYRGRPDTSGNRGRGRPQAAPQQAAPPAVQANPNDQRGRERGRPPDAGPQAAREQAPPPAAAANPGHQGQQQPGHGRGKPDKADKGAKDNKDNKDKKDKDKEKP